MSFSPELAASLAGYMFKNALRRRKRYPMVLVLEPLFRCNLQCLECGRIREYGDILDRTMTAAECLEAVKEAGAPVVSITGGEPLLHPDIEAIVASVLKQKRFVHLCTNGLLLKKSLNKFKPDVRFSFVFHLDGMAATHDKSVAREGVYDEAIAAIETARQSGFRVLVNTTIHKQPNMREIKMLFTLLAGIPVNGIMVAPAFDYEAAGDQTCFSRDEIHRSFRELNAMRRNVLFYNTPLYLEFLAGNVDLPCTPWSTPTRNPKGWKKPCYLITDGHCESFRELMEQTNWDHYGPGNDPRCANCMVHCGFEASALAAMKKNPRYLYRTVAAMR